MIKKLNITQENDFLRVFEIPELPENLPYCFGGGVDVPFKMVDWFGTSGIETRNPIEVQESLTEFISGKQYYDKNKNFLIVCEFGLIFIIYKNDK